MWAIFGGVVVRRGDFWRGQRLRRCAGGAEQSQGYGGWCVCGGGGVCDQRQQLLPAPGSGEAAGCGCGVEQRYTDCGDLHR